MNIIKRFDLFGKISPACVQLFYFPFTRGRSVGSGSYRGSLGRSSIRRMCASNQAQTQLTHQLDYEDFFRYTSGRWLWDEEQQLQDRYRVFDVDKLKDVSAKSVGSDSCASIIKLAEGGYNKIFRLVMNDGKTVIARIPNPNSGPPFYTTASEVATMELVRTVLQIPVPQVYAWSSTVNNPVGAEYIIMEEAEGTPLANEWDKMPADSKLTIMKEIVSVEKRLLSLSFSHYGNIYFACDNIAGAVPAKITSGTSSELKDTVSKTFTIGHSVEKGFWNKERSKMNINRGPWLTPLDYVTSVAAREITWNKSYAVPKAKDDPLLVSNAQNNPHAHITLLEKFLKVASYLLDIDKELNRPTIWHTDLHSSNLFVDKNGITTVIDWQGIWAGPLFLQAQPSKLVNYEGNMLFKRPENFNDLHVKEKTQIKQQIFKSTLFQLYLLETEEHNPTLAKAFHMDHGKTRRLPMEFAGNTWDDDIMSFREALINVERHWDDLGIEGECPIHFNEDELNSHLQDADGWNEVQDLFDGIEALVKRDGWTSNETYDDALAFFSDLRKVGLNKMRGKEREDFEKETRWAER